MATIFKMVGFIAGGTLALLAGDFAGRWLTTSREYEGLWRGIGSITSACIYTWLYFKWIGPIGPHKKDVTHR